MAAAKVSIPCYRRKGSELSLKVDLWGPSRRGSRQSLTISSWATTAAKSETKAKNLTSAQGKLRVAISLPPPRLRCLFRSVSEESRSSQRQRVVPHKDGGGVTGTDGRTRNSVAFGLPGRLHVAPVIGSGDVEYQAYPGVYHS